MNDDDKELVARLRADMRVVQRWAEDESPTLSGTAAARIEALSAEVARLTRERDQLDAGYEGATARAHENGYYAGMEQAKRLAASVAAKAADADAPIVQKTAEIIAEMIDAYMAQEAAAIRAAASAPREG